MKHKGMFISYRSIDDLRLWDKRFLSLAEHVGSWSKDPSRKVGAVITDDDHRVLSVGFNGFARGVSDREDRYEEREVKLAMVIHAESNAILFGNTDLTGSTIYTTLPPCATCAAHIIQAGIIRVVCLDDDHGHHKELALEILNETGVEVDLVKDYNA